MNTNPAIAKQQAQQEITSAIGHNPLILDTETTRLDAKAEIIEIGIIDINGNTVFHSLVKPFGPIPSEATAIHGISDADVANAPTWPDIHQQVSDLISQRQIIIYNAEYDRRLLTQTAIQYGLPSIMFADWCAMHAVAKWFAEWDPKREQWKWQRLTSAAEKLRVTLPDTSQAHRAIYDCQLTRGVLLAIAAQQNTAISNQTDDPCTACDGSSICTLCDGDGIDPESGPPTACRECSGTAACAACNGSGYTEHQHTA